MKKLQWRRRHYSKDEDTAVKMKALQWIWRHCSEDEGTAVKMKALQWRWRHCSEDEETTVKTKILQWRWRHCSEDIETQSTSHTRISNLGWWRILWFYKRQIFSPPIINKYITRCVSSPYTVMGLKTAFEMWRHTRRNQISSFGEKDESIYIGGGLQFSLLLAAELCASAVVMLATPCSEVTWRVPVTHSIRQFQLHSPSRASPCSIIFQLDSTILLCCRWLEWLPYMKSKFNMQFKMENVHQINNARKTFWAEACQTVTSVHQRSQKF